VSHIVIGTAGHIDHGKSTLVRALTGIDPDRLKEEKARGITIELGFAHARIGETDVAFVDVPGHERFVRTMLAGVGGIDLVMLVVAADESVMPQTREHFDICRLLRVPRGLVVLTKADLVDAETVDLVRLEVRELVEGSFLEGAPVIPVSAASGAGLPALRDAILAVAAPPERRTAGDAVRLPIDRAFTMRGFGTVVTGTLVTGAIDVEQELVLLPSGRPVKVRGVQVHGARQARVLAGQRAAVNLGGIEVAEVGRGQTLSSRGSIRATRRADATLELLPGARPLKHGARVRIHQGTAEVLGRVSVSGVDVAAVEPGASTHVRLRLESPAVLTRGDRFIVRAYSPPATVGGGQVLDPDPPRTGVRTAAAAARWAALAMPAEDQEDERARAWMVREAGAAGLPVSALVSRAGVPASDLAEAVAALERAGAAVVAGDRLVAPVVLEALGARLTALLGEYHRAQPLADGMPREEARERVLAGAGLAVFEQVLARLVDAGTLVARDRLALRSHRLELTTEEARTLEAVARIYREAGLTPPDVAAVSAAAGSPAALVEKMSALLLRRKELVRIDTLIFHHDVLARLKTDVADIKAAAGGGEATVDVAAFKERYGITRKFAIPLLEYLDRERVTRRRGDARVIL
jgi:selenocysteine-specific elongation factor